MIGFLVHEITEHYGEKDRPNDRRERWILVCEGLAVEVWRWMDADTLLGGVEFHAPARFPHSIYLESCRIRGGPCWCTGSGLAVQEFEGIFDQPEKVRARLEQLADQWEGETRRPRKNYGRPSRR